MPTLTILSGNQRGRELVLPDGQILVGSDPGCDLQLKAPLIGTRHCVLTSRSEKLHIRVLDRSPGVDVNGRSIRSEYTMQPGDILHLGSLLLKLADAQKTIALGTTRNDPGGGTSIENSIANWLLPGDTQTGGRTAPAIEPTESKKPEEDRLSAGSRRSKSVGEEGDEIIRRFLAMQQNKSSDS